ncbi:hypothetical protein EDD21DRAFT_385092 [Dissophora ornata]|nr:hypothetical protein EDD21DRAFT_385092 [Dissophora ornata]
MDLTKFCGKLWHLTITWGTLRHWGHFLYLFLLATSGGSAFLEDDGSHLTPLSSSLFHFLPDREAKRMEKEA